MNALLHSSLPLLPSPQARSAELSQTHSREGSPAPRPKSQAATASPGIITSSGHAHEAHELTTVPLHMVYPPPQHFVHQPPPYGLVPLARTVSLPHPLMHSSPEPPHPVPMHQHVYMMPPAMPVHPPHIHLLEQPLSSDSSGGDPFPPPYPASLPVIVEPHQPPHSRTQSRFYPETPPGSPQQVSAAGLMSVPSDSESESSCATDGDSGGVSVYLCLVR